MACTESVKRTRLLQVAVEEPYTVDTLKLLHGNDTRLLDRVKLVVRWTGDWEVSGLHCWVWRTDGWFPIACV